jgi:E3 ubiquitin-protein ligase DOA10
VRDRAGHVYHLVISPNYLHVACPILRSSTFNSDFLPLGCWDHVYVSPPSALSLHHCPHRLRYSFAILLSGCRTILRPGAMWFIRDPQDQNSHPIRDILDRPTLTQLRKIILSAVMYSLVVACVVASVAGLLMLGRKLVMPLRWKNRQVQISHLMFCISLVETRTGNLCRMYQLTLSFSTLCFHIRCITFGQ